MIVENYRWHGPKQPCMLIYLGEQEEQYKLWINGDPDEDVPKPDPTFIFSENEMNDLVIGWLTGPPGPTGPIGAPGAKGESGIRRHADN